jgi:type I restriction enzyme, S subunit
VRRGDLPGERLDPGYVRNTKKQSYAYPKRSLARLVSEEPCYGTSARAVERTSENQPRYLRITDYSDDGIILPHEFMTAEEWANKHMLSAGDLLFARSGATVGKTYLHDTRFDPAVFAGYCIRFRFKSEVLPEFVYGFTKTDAYALWVTATQRPAGQPNINKEEFKSLEIPLPPLGVQRHLVAELDAARAERDRALAEAERLIGTFEQWAINQMGLSAPKEDGRKVYAIKRNAAETRIDPFYHSPEFVEIERTIQAAPHALLGSLVQFSVDTWNAKEHPEPTFRYIEISGVDRRRGQALASDFSVADSPSRARMVVQPNDIIISLTRPHHGSIALLNDTHKGCIASTGLAVIHTVDENRISRTFLWAALRLSLSLKQMLRRSSGGNYPAITQDELAKVLIPLPDKPIQQKIVEEVIYRNKEADRLEAHAETVWQKARARFEQQLLKGVPL